MPMNMTLMTMTPTMVLGKNADDNDDDEDDNRDEDAKGGGGGVDVAAAYGQDCREGWTYDPNLGSCYAIPTGAQGNWAEAMVTAIVFSQRYSTPR